MNVLRAPKQSLFRVFSFLAFLLVALVFSATQSSHGQDVEAVEARLKEAIHEGEISIEQAYIMLQALKRSMYEHHHKHRDHDEGYDHEHGHHEHDDHEHDHYEHGEHDHHDHEHGDHDHGDDDDDRMMERIEDALLDSGIEESAIDSTMELIEKIAEQMYEEREEFRPGNELKHYMEKELELNGKQMRLVFMIAERFAKMGAEGGRENKHDHEHDGVHEGLDSARAKRMKFREIAEKIEWAVKEGDLSKQEAEEKLMAIKQEMFGREGGASKEVMEAKKRAYMKMEEQIKIAVENGDMSKLDADEKLSAIRQKMFGDGGQSRKSNDSEKKEKWEGFMLRIKQAVESGRITEEQAEERIIEYKKRLNAEANESRGAEGKGDNKMEARKRRYAAVVEKIKDAIEAGKISEEEAEERIQQLRKRMSDKNRD